MTRLLTHHAHMLYKASLEALQFYFKHKQMPHFDTNKLHPILQEKGACFVTLEKNLRLRGCIGTIEAHRPIIADVIFNTINAAFSDHRFPALSVEECRETTISYSLLTPQEKQEFSSEQDLLNLLRPHIDGLVISDQGKRAVYLPSVWEQIPDKGIFLAQLKIKAGLPQDHFSSTFQAWTFQADKTTPMFIQAP